MKRDKKGRFIKGSKPLQKWIKNRRSYKGKNHPNWKGKTPKCIDCDEKVSFYSKRCRKCAGNLRKGQNNPFYGKTHTKRARKIISKMNSVPKAHLKCEHHIDLNRDNNKKRNKLILTNSKHSSLHYKAYQYLVEINKINRYIKWFDRKYGLK